MSATPSIDDHIVKALEELDWAQRYAGSAGESASARALVHVQLAQVMILRDIHALLEAEQFHRVREDLEEEVKRDGHEP